MYRVYDNGVPVQGTARLDREKAIKAYFDYVVSENYRLDIHLVNEASGEIIS